ncbi:MAG: hypothetical protein ACK6BG_06815 [Cyanobacteriota bacterium]
MVGAGEVTAGVQADVAPDQAPLQGVVRCRRRFARKRGHERQGGTASPATLTHLAEQLTARFRTETKRDLFGFFVDAVVGLTWLGSMVGIGCQSLDTVTDITVWRAGELSCPWGPRQALPVFTNRQLVVHPRASRPVVHGLLAP